MIFMEWKGGIYCIKKKTIEMNLFFMGLLWAVKFSSKSCGRDVTENHFSEEEEKKNFNLQIKVQISRRIEFKY